MSDPIQVNVNETVIRVTVSPILLTFTSGGPGGPVTWSSITDKPATFPPEAHTHAWGSITDKPADFPPEAHTHAWLSITDKPATFPPSAHTHAWLTITDKPATFPPEAHTHDDKAPLASPAFTGVPTAPTAAPGTNTLQLATTAFVRAAVLALIDASPAALDTLYEIAAAVGNNPNFAADIAALIGAKAPLANPAFTGAPTAPTAATATNNTQLATTEFVRLAIAAFAPGGEGGGVDSYAELTDSGTVDLPALNAPLAAALAVLGKLGFTNTWTAANTFSGGAVLSGSNTYTDGSSFTFTAAAITAFLTAVGGASAPTGTGKIVRAASPALTGTPTAPTAATATNTTQLATTAFVKAVVADLVASSPAALDTLNEFAVALGNDPNFATTITNALAAKAPLANPAFTGTPTVPTAAPGTDTTQAASTAYVLAAIAAKFAAFIGPNVVASGTTMAANMAAGRIVHIKGLAHNATLTLSNLGDGQSGSVVVWIGGSGGYTFALDHAGLTNVLIQGAFTEFPPLASGRKVRVTFERADTELHLWIKVLP